MKRRKRFLLPLLMAIVMMAMSPQQLWAENLTVNYGDNITISSDATYDNVIVNDGTLTIKNGATLTINKNYYIDVSGGTVIIESGATVTFHEDGYFTICGGKTFNYGTINGDVFLTTNDYCFANWDTVKGDVYNVDNNNNCVNFYNFGTIEGQVTDIVKAFDSCVNHNGTNFAPTCTDAGFTRCNECGEISNTTPALGHTLTAHPAAAATCTTDGYSSDCWSCSACGKYFSDAEGKNVIAASSVVIPTEGHNFVNGICSVCGTGSITDSEGTDDDGNTITISTVVGNVVLTEDASYEKLVLSNNATLTINQGVTLHVDAMEVGAGCKVTNSGTISYYTYMYDINIYGNLVNLGKIEYGTLKLYDDATACNHGTVGYNATIFGDNSMYYSTSGGQVCYYFQGGTLYDAPTPGTTSSVSVPATCTTAGTEKTSCDVCGSTLSETPIAIDPDAHSWENNTCTLCAAVRITYTASAKLAETTSQYSTGLHTNAFGSATVSSHTFENGVGTITFSADLTSIGDNAFYQCSNLTGITIPSGVTSIGKAAFAQCFNLASITIPNSVTSIGGFAFNSCYVASSNLHNSSSIDLTQYSLTIVDTEQADGLLIKDNCAVKCRPGSTSLNIPSSVTSIGKYAFNGRSNLSSITFTTPSSVTSIGEYAFCLCTNLASITIPSGVTSIGKAAFDQCTNLSSITIPSSVTSIGKNAFYDCSNLTSITIPSSVTSIGEGTFDNCSNLTSITIPSSVTSIGEDAFYGCTSLTTVICKGATPATLGNNAFRYWNDNTEDIIDLPNLNIYVPASSVDTYKAATNWSDYASKIKATAASVTTSAGATTFYDTFGAAFAAAADDSTITLYEDVTIENHSTLGDPALEIMKEKYPTNGLTIDLGQNKLSLQNYSEHTDAIRIYENNKITIKNGTLYFKDFQTGIVTDSPITFDGVSIDGTDLKFATPDGVNSDVCAIYSQQADVVLNNSTVTVPSGNYSYANNRYIDGNHSLTLTGTSKMDGNIILHNCTVKAASTATIANCTMYVDGESKGTLSIANGTFTAPTDYKWTAGSDGLSTLSQHTPVLGDLNGDDNITIADLALLVQVLNSNGTITNAAADVNGDGTVNLDDVEALRSKVLEVDAGDDPNLLVGVFTVSAGADGIAGTADDKKVQFTKSNLYWDGSAYQFEANQTAYPESWEANHIGHFYWSQTATVAYEQTYSDGSRGTTDKLFCGEDNKLTVSGTSDLYVLSAEEWHYLTGLYNEFSYTGNRSDAYRFANARVNGVAGLLIFPDGYNGTVSGDGIATVNKDDVQTEDYPSASILDATWSAMEAAGVVFLPAAGCRSGQKVDNCGNNGYYWSSTLVDKDNAYMLYDYYGIVDCPKNQDRNRGCSIRLVKTVE